MRSYATLDVSGFVLVNDVVLCKFVEHLLHFGEKFCCNCLVRGGTEDTNSITRGLSVISVVESARCRLADTFYR